VVGLDVCRVEPRRGVPIDASYLKEIVDLSSLAALKFSLATSLGSYRRDVPRAALFAAGITAVRFEGRASWIRRSASSLTGVACLA
jgi:hypothetical protein